MTHKQVGVLAVVDVEPEISQREIATRLNVAPSLVVTLIDQLVDLGAVQRVRHSHDRRAYAIKITTRGQQLLGSAIALAQELDDEIQAGLSPVGREALGLVLDEIARGAEARR